MRIRSLQFKVLVLVAGVMAVAVGVGVASITRVYATIQDLDRISREDFEAQSAILRGTVAFKQQVQEWKNVLLRGKDAQLLAKHWKAFEDAEHQVGVELKDARASTAHDEVRNLLEAAMAQHKADGESYRGGLERFKASN